MDVLRDVTNDRLYRTITVRGGPKSVAHAVRILCEVSLKVLGAFPQCAYVGVHIVD